MKVPIYLCNFNKTFHGCLPWNKRFRFKGYEVGIENIYSHLGKLKNIKWGLKTLKNIKRLNQLSVK